MDETTDVCIIGAGPSGAIAAALLRQRGRRVCVLERSHFPRFSIGESLLPQCMVYIEEAGMGEAVKAAGFQHKNGATFLHNGISTAIDFRDKFTPGPGTTYQVQRADFDDLLAREAARAGAELRFGHQVKHFDHDDNGRQRLRVTDEQGADYHISCGFVLDASGFGRVLPQLLDQETPSGFPARTAIFTHIEDNISDPGYDRDKIIIAIHAEHRDIWFWLIPFSNGRSSIGVVGQSDFHGEGSPETQLKAAIAGCPDLARLLANARFDTPVRTLSGYSCNVRSLWGRGYALLGNAGEFLDPIFSSGVTIAMKSASLAAPLVDRYLKGEAVDWQAEFAAPLSQGVNTFKVYVSSWYEGGFQDVIFHPAHQPGIRAMISSILAGYAWDKTNPLVQEPQRRLDALVALCR